MLQDVLALFHVSSKRCMGTMHDDVKPRSPCHLQATNVHVYLLGLDFFGGGYRMDAAWMQTQYACAGRRSDTAATGSHWR
jgi:hypothetical protein